MKIVRMWFLKDLRQTISRSSSQAHAARARRRHADPILSHAVWHISQCADHQPDGSLRSVTGPGRALIGWLRAAGTVAGDLSSEIVARSLRIRVDVSGCQCH